MVSGRVPTRLYLNMASQVWGRLVSNVGVRLLRLPLMLTVLGPEDFGRWLVLASLSSWLSIPTTGTSSVAAASMSMSTGGGDMPSARRSYSELVALNGFLSLSLAGLAFILSMTLPLQNWLGIPMARKGETSLALLLLSSGVLLSGMAETFGTRLKAAGRSHVQAFWLGSMAWLELLLLLVMLRFTKRFDCMALASLLVSLCLATALYLGSRMALPQVRFDRSCVAEDGVGALFRKSLYFQAFPLGNAVLLQGMILVVQWTLGPAAVAVYSTARTIVRVVSQGLETVNHSVWPEMSLQFGSGNLPRIAVLHRSSVMFSLGVSVVSASLLLLFGPGLYALASGKTLTADRALLAAFLVSVPLNALWYTSSMVQLACNRHEGLSKRYLLSTCVAWAAGLLLAESMGLPGAAMATSVSDLIMIPYVLRRSVSLTGDAFEGIWSRACKDMLNLTGRIAS